MRNQDEAASRSDEHGKARRSATELMRDDSELFRALSRASFEAIFLSEKGICIGQNQRAEEMFGFTTEEAIGRPGTDWIVPDERQKVMDHMLAGYEHAYETAALRKDGTTFPCEIQGKMMNYRGRTIRVTALHDISERKQVEQQRIDLVRRTQHAQKLESLGVLAGGVAHDFNNLLMVVLGNTDLALGLLPEDAEIRPMLLDIESATRRAAELTRQMLAYSGMDQIRRRPVNLGQLVSGMAQLLETALPGPVDLMLNHGVDVPLINADLDQLRQVVINLVTNAGESFAEGERGRIVLQTGSGVFSREAMRGALGAEPPASGRFVWLEVRDDGCGMDRETRERMFDPFFSTKFTGRGMGMAATLGIVRGHRGLIHVDSEPDRGTTVRVYFPEHASARRRPEAEAAPWCGEGTVLLVDDDPGVLNVARSMVERCGFTALTASDGDEALSTFRERGRDIACVILDLKMKRMSGEETLRNLYALQPDVRVVIASGYAEQDLRNRFQGHRLAGFIQKPYKMNDLRRLLRDVIGPGQLPPGPA